MPVALRSILLIMTLTLSVAVAAKEDIASVISGLTYREALFQHHSGRPFLALTHLLMATGRGHMTEDAQRLLAELYLEYGLHARAEHILANSASAQARPVPGKAWLMLGTGAGRHGDHDLAERALARARMDDTAKGQADLTMAEIRLDQGRNGEAMRLLTDWRGAGDLMPYARYNQAIALRRMEQNDRANEILASLGRIGASDIERRRIRDRANLSLALSLLDDGQAGRARRALDRIHLDGPLAGHALLAAGRAEMALGNPDAAEAAWARLARGDRNDPAVLNAMILRAGLAQERGQAGLAASRYREALAGLREAVQTLNAGMERIRQGFLPRITSPGKLAFPGQDTMQPVYVLLTRLFASSGFHHGLVHLRELETMQDNLEHWRDNLPVYRHMLETHEQRREQHLGHAHAMLDETGSAKLAIRARRLDDRIRDARQDDTGLALITPAEQAQWQRLDRIGRRLDALPGGTKQKDSLRQKAERLRGLLLWRMATRYPERRWNAEKQAVGLREALTNLATRQQSLGQAIESSPRRFAGQGRRIDKLAGRVNELLEKTAKNRRHLQSSLQRLATRELERHREELEMLTIEARYALARLHDHQAEQNDSEATP